MSSAESSTIVVLAKAPAPGRVKTRLIGAFTAEQAADLALAALLDTIGAALLVPGARVVLALEGTAGSWLPRGVTVVAQRGDGLDQRIAAALADAWNGRPILLVGMDTPQVTGPLLASCLDTLADAEVVLGHSLDGGWWALGLHTPDEALLLGVPMSTEQTGAEQERRIRASGRTLDLLPELLDVDTPDDAFAVAALVPGSRFATALAGALSSSATGGARARMTV